MSKPSIETQLNTLEEGHLAPLKEVLRICRRNGLDPATYWDQIPPARMEKLDDKQRELIEFGAKSPFEFGWDHFDPESFDDIFWLGRHLLDDKFKLVRHQNNLFLFEVMDLERKLLVSIYEGDDMEIIVREICRRSLEDRKQPLPNALATTIARTWKNHQSDLSMPKPMARPSEDVWCLHRPSVVPDAEMESPTWTRLLKRMSDPEAFAAWVWGVYSGENRGRQILWLHGPHGEDGKSAIASLIAEDLFGPSHHAIGNAHLGSSEKRFLTSYFENASLVIYPDANNRKVLLSEAFKSIASAGSDPVLIERKGKQAYSSRLKARMWVCSNHPPDITTDNFVTSRLLYVHIDKMKDEAPDPGAIGRLRDELPAFLHFAKCSYEGRCSDSYKIETNQPTVDAVAALSQDFYEEYETIFLSRWEKGTPDDSVDARDLRDAVREEGIRSNQEYSRFTDWMVNEMGVAKKKLSQLNGKTFYYGMRKRSSSNVSDLDILKEEA